MRMIFFEECMVKWERWDCRIVMNLVWWLGCMVSHIKMRSIFIPKPARSHIRAAYTKVDQVQVQYSSIDCCMSL